MKRKLYYLLFIFYLFLFYSCERSTAPENPNLYPNTTIANIPKENDTIFALVTLHWDGEDFDGYIDGYEYRYITHRIFMGDSIVQEWKFTKETSLTIPFLSDDQLNKQVFQVRAIDNKNNRDETPAEKVFFTIQTIFPETEIIYPENDSTYFILDQPTDWWEGIEFSFSGFDRDGEIIEYGWSVDNKEIIWTNDTSVVVTPDKFNTPLTGTHTLSVIAKDNTNLEDPTPAEITINLIKPTFDRKILIVDATNESNFPSGLQFRPTDAVVDSFYSEVFPNSDNWDYKTNGMPLLNILGQYKLIIWHSDDFPSTQPHPITNHTNEIRDYLNVGGNIVIGGWRILKSFAWTENFPKSFEEGTFVHDYLHIVSVDETSLIGDMTGAIGLNDVYSNIKIDSIKLAGFPYYGKLGNVNLILLPGGFTDGIYFYQNNDDSPYTEYRGRTIGLRYYGTSFQSTVLGFPMYFIKKEDAIRMGSEILEQMGIN